VFGRHFGFNTLPRFLDRRADHVISRLRRGIALTFKHKDWSAGTVRSPLVFVPGKQETHGLLCALTGFFALSRPDRAGLVGGLNGDAIAV
jgi:hypothetical protein